MKNVIVLLIDSLTSNCIGSERTGVSSTPFLDTMLSSAIYAPNVYSYGPYTDAATKSLWCSMPALSDYGYYFSINASEINPYKIFKENGYETYGFYYPYYMMSPKIVQNIDHTVYTSGYAFYANWRNFGYYAEEMKSRSLSDDEILLMTNSLELIFMGWTQYYENIENDMDAGLLLKDISPVNMMERIKSAHYIVCEEYKKFLNDKRVYLKEFLKLGMQHVLANVDPFDINLRIDKNFLSGEIYKRYKGFFSKAQKVNVSRNLRNNHFSVKKMIKGVSDYIRTRDPYELKYPVNYYLGINSINNCKAKSLKPNWQYQASARRQIETGMELIAKRDSSKPFYMIFHVEEPHEPIAFFSYDIKDRNKIKEEFEYIEPLVHNCSKDFKGSLGYQLAVRYDDYCLKMMIEKLKELNLADDTIVMIVADHGSSYLYAPARKRTVNCFHKENYNVPMIIWDNSIKEKIYIEEKCTSADVYATLYDYLGFSVKGIRGKSILKKTYSREYVITEYMGPGCPDMLTRDAWMSIRNDTWMIAYKINLSHDFNPNNPHQVFNLIEDPDETKNLARKIDMSSDELKRLAFLIGDRFNEIKRDRDCFIYRLRNGEINFGKNNK